jgi:MSHA biogenesis protein MshP
MTLRASQGALQGASQGASPRRRQAGLSGVLVLAAIVMMASLSTFGVTLITSVHTSFAQELSVARAAQAAEAGLEWARFQITRTPVPVCPALQTLAMPGLLAGYSSSVRCTLTGTHSESGVTVRTYSVSATGCNAAACPAAPNSDYVERQVRDWIQR